MAIERYIQGDTGIYKKQANLFKKALIQVESIESLEEQLICIKLPFRLDLFEPPPDPFETILQGIHKEIEHRKQLHVSCQQVGLSFENEAANHLISLINRILCNPLALLHQDFLSLNQYLTNQSPSLSSIIEHMISLPVEVSVSRERRGSFFEKLAQCTDVEVNSCNVLLQRVATAITKTNQQGATALNEEKLMKSNGLLQKLLKIYLDIQQPSSAPEKRGDCVIL